MFFHCRPAQYAEQNWAGVNKRPQFIVLIQEEGTILTTATDTCRYIHATCYMHCLRLLRFHFHNIWAKLTARDSCMSHLPMRNGSVTALSIHLCSLPAVSIAPLHLACSQHRPHCGRDKGQCLAPSFASFSLPSEVSWKVAFHANKESNTWAFRDAENRLCCTDLVLRELETWVSGWDAGYTQTLGGDSQKHGCPLCAQRHSISDLLKTWPDYTLGNLLVSLVMYLCLCLLEFYYLFSFTCFPIT